MPARAPSRREGSAAGGAAAGGAAEAVRAGADPPGGEHGGIEVADMRRRARGRPQAEGVVEVAVVEPAVPAHVDLVAAHETGERLRVELLLEEPPVAFELPISLEVVEEPADGHVGDGDEPREADAVPREQLPPVVGFQSQGVRRQRGSRGVVDEVERELGPGPVADLVQEADGLYAPRVDPAASLPVDVVLQVAGETGDEVHP